jgi:hypothetical protein
MGTDSYADVVERLFGEFDGALPLPEIARLVGQCRQHWSGSSALEGLESEARQRLTDLSRLARSDPLTGLPLPGAWAPAASPLGQTTLEPA